MEGTRIKLRSGCFAVCLMVGSAQAGPQLLMSIDRTGNGSRAPDISTRMPVILRYADIEPDPIVVGSSTLWGDGETGTVDFDADNDPHFDAAALLLTNGVDDELTFFAGGGGSGRLESMWGFGTPDLVGYEVETIRLIVHSAEIHPWFHDEFGEGREWSFDITWQFYGTPVPEPGTAALLLMSGPVAMRRQRLR